MSKEFLARLQADDINLYPVAVEESAGESRKSNLNSNYDPPASDKGGASFGTFQLNQENVKNFVDNSPWAEQFKGMDLTSRAGRKAFDRKWKSLADTDPEFETAQAKAALDLPNTKQALRFAQRLAGEKELTPNLKGYAAGVGINMGDASAQWHILQPLKMYAEGTLTESEALKQMAIRRTQVNKRFKKDDLIGRNTKEPSLFDSSINKDEMTKAVKAVAGEDRKPSDLMLEMIDAMPKDLQKQYLSSSTSKKHGRDKLYKNYKIRQEKRREAQRRQVYREVERFIKTGGLR